MSCGDPHETDCGEVLDEVYLYLDLECADERRDADPGTTSTSARRACASTASSRRSRRWWPAAAATTGADELRDRLRVKLTALVVETREPR